MPSLFCLMTAPYSTYIEKETGQKVFKIRKTHNIRCAKKLDIMHFIVRRFTSFFPEMSFCPASFRELKTVSFIL